MKLGILRAQGGAFISLWRHVWRHRSLVTATWSPGHSWPVESGIFISGSGGVSLVGSGLVQQNWGKFLVVPPYLSVPYKVGSPQEAGRRECMAASNPSRCWCFLIHLPLPLPFPLHCGEFSSLSPQPVPEGLLRTGSRRTPLTCFICTPAPASDTHPSPLHPTSSGCSGYGFSGVCQAPAV